MNSRLVQENNASDVAHKAIGGNCQAIWYWLLDLTKNLCKSILFCNKYPQLVRISGPTWEISPLPIRSCYELPPSCRRLHLLDEWGYRHTCSPRSLLCIPSTWNNNGDGYFAKFINLVTSWVKFIFFFFTTKLYVGVREHNSFLTEE